MAKTFFLLFLLLSLCQLNYLVFLLMYGGHSCSKDETFWRNQWGGNVLFCHGTNYSAGVSILFDRNFGGSIIHSFFSSEGRWIIVVVILADSLFILINVYGYNNRSQNRNFFRIYLIEFLT